MIENQAMITIACPANIVFANLTNPKNFENFNSIIEPTNILAKTLAAVGSEFTMDVHDGERRVPVTFRVRRFDPPKFFAYKSVAGTEMSIVVRYFFEDAGEKTRITYQHQIDPGNSIDPARAKSIRAEMRQRFEQDFEKLKAALESRV